MAVAAMDGEFSVSELVEKLPLLMEELQKLSRTGQNAIAGAALMELVRRVLSESSEALQAIMDSTFAHNAWVVPKQLLTASSRVLPDPSSGVQRVFPHKTDVRQWSSLHFYIQMIIFPRQAWDKT